MKAFPQSMARLIDEFSKMPGIGPRSAERLAFYILQTPADGIDALINSIRGVKARVQFCKRCNNLSDTESCAICSDASRDRSKICVVEGPNGVIAVEKSGVYSGLYHVLLGQLSPIDGVGPEELKINELAARIKKEKIEEVIIATDFTTEGETTALYLFEFLKPLKVKLTRLAHGVPVGASVEYADSPTLQRAFEERREI